MGIVHKHRLPRPLPPLNRAPKSLSPGGRGRDEGKPKRWILSPYGARPMERLSNRRTNDSRTGLVRTGGGRSRFAGAETASELEHRAQALNLTGNCQSGTLLNSVSAVTFRLLPQTPHLRLGDHGESDAKRREPACRTVPIRVGSSLGRVLRSLHRPGAEYRAAEAGLRSAGSGRCRAGSIRVSGVFAQVVRFPVSSHEVCLHDRGACVHSALPSGKNIQKGRINHCRRSP